MLLQDCKCRAVEPPSAMDKLCFLFFVRVKLQSRFYEKNERQNVTGKAVSKEKKQEKHKGKKRKRDGQVRALAQHATMLVHPVCAQHCTSNTGPHACVACRSSSVHSPQSIALGHLSTLPMWLLWLYSVDVQNMRARPSPDQPRRRCPSCAQIFR